MSTISERILQIVEIKEGGNKSAFSRRLNVTPAYITKLSKNPNDVPSERLLISICKEYGCSMEWLKTGEGEPFAPKTREEEIAEFITNAMQRTPDDERQKLIKAIQGMTDAEILMLAEVLDRFK